MPGFDDVRAEQSVGLRLVRSSGPISRTTFASNFSRLRVRIGIGALFFLDKSNGDVKGKTVSFNIKIRPIAGSDFVNENISITGKSRGPVDFEYEYKLSGTGPWVVTVERLTEDPTSTAVSDDLFFKGIVGILDRSFRYPNSALIGIKIGAENFTGVPLIAAEMLGVKVKFLPITILSREYILECGTALFRQTGQTILRGFFMTCLRIRAMGRASLLMQVKWTDIACFPSLNIATSLYLMEQEV